MLRRVFLILALLPLMSSAVEVPREALKYRAPLIRETRAALGITAPVAVFAAQIHQESRWRPDAISRAGARGMTQFMPGTERWIKDIFPELADGQGAMNPIWSIRALVRYDVWLMERIHPADSLFDCVHGALRSYNGGLGHWMAEARNAAPATDRASIDAACGTARRHKSHCRENLGYPKRILIDLQPLYLAWGPGVEP